MTKPRSWRNAIIQVLDDHNGEPVHYKDIAREVEERDLVDKLGANPPARANLELSSSIKKLGDRSPFRRRDAGVYTLSKFTDQDIQKATDKAPDRNIVRAFGVYWLRSEVLWETRPSLMGRTADSRKADPVNLTDQIGIYLLHDGREVVYVGRAKGTPDASDRAGLTLGRRLSQHTADRHRARWDRFSWFGLCEVQERKLLRPDPAREYDIATIITALEAVLIESIEPRQNRKQGDLLGTEYIQAEDPAIAQQKDQQAILRLLEQSRATGR